MDDKAKLCYIAGLIDEADGTSTYHNSVKGSNLFNF